MNNKYIRAIPFDPSDPKTHSDDEEYYNSNNHGGDVYLTNGTNKFFSIGGGGTNAAVSCICPEAFDTENRTLIYKPDATSSPAGELLDSYDQLMIHRDTEGREIMDPVGTVYYSRIESDQFKRVKGVYHINGLAWNFRIGTEDNREMMQGVIAGYYQGIIRDFLGRSRSGDILHLVRSPGNIYGDRGETTIGILKALKPLIPEVIRKQVYLNIDVTKEALNSCIYS